MGLMRVRRQWIASIMILLIVERSFATSCPRWVSSLFGMVVIFPHDKSLVVFRPFN